MKRITPLAAVVSLVFASSAFASVKWRGDFETGDISQWSQTEMVSPDRLQVVPSPTREGKYALRAEVRQGDDPINASGNRNELVKQDGASEGTEFYYGWSTLFPSDYPLTPTWQVFTQWHHPGSSGGPPVRFVLGCSASDCGQPLPDTLFFIVDGQNVWTMAPVTRGEWHDFVFHVKWSANASVGFVELWYDGQLVVPKKFIRTLYNSGDTNYMKMGLYRDEATAPTAAVFHDAMVQATTFAEAVPPPRDTNAPTPTQSETPVASGPTSTTPPTGATTPSSGTSFPTSPTGVTSTGPATAGCSASGTEAFSWLGVLALFGFAPMVLRRSRREAVRVQSRRTR